MTILGPAILLIATLVSLELVPALGLMESFAGLAHRGRRALRLVVRTGVSEWAKERALRLASDSLLRASLRSGGLLLLVAAPIIAVVALDAVVRLGVRAALTDWPVRLCLLLISSAYLLIRWRLRQGGPVVGERLLQRVALGNRAVLDLSFTLERRMHPPRTGDSLGGHPLFVVGLARAGTSILTRLLHETGAFASLTYRDLPFPLAPNSWARVSGRLERAVAPAERGHADGLLHDLDSPEAIEELFWLCQEGERYRQRHGLVPVAPRSETITAFRDYVRLVRRRHGPGRYLSKNNANILRLPALVAAFDRALLVHPFRDPIEQSASLLSQHLHASALAADDPFRRDFMRWLGHHEFGADHRPFLLAGDDPCEGDPAGIDYWLRRWIEAYGFLLDQPDSVSARQIFVDYDALCVAPEAHLQQLGDAVGVRMPDPAALRPPVVRHAGRHAAPALIVRAQALHAELVARSSGIGAAEREPKPSPACGRRFG